jgi:hypothetical protein
MPVCRIDYLRVARKTSGRGITFRSTEGLLLPYRSVVFARRLLSTWKVRSDKMSCARLNLR